MTEPETYFFRLKNITNPRDKPVKIRVSWLAFAGAGAAGGRGHYNSVATKDSDFKKSVTILIFHESPGSLLK